MTPDTFKDLWLVYYDFDEKAFGVYSVRRWLKDDLDLYLKKDFKQKKQARPSCVILDVLETELEAKERLKEIKN